LPPSPLLLPPPLPASSVLSFLRLWLNKRQYYFHKDDSLREELILWTESFEETDLLPTTVLSFKLFVKDLVSVIFFQFF
jgi:hypothetical protein